MYLVVLYWYYIKVKLIYKTLTIPCEKSKIVSFASSEMKNIVVFSSQSRFPGKIVYCIAFELASSACCYLNLLQSSFSIFKWG